MYFLDSKINGESFTLVLPEGRWGWWSVREREYSYDAVTSVVRVAVDGIFNREGARFSGQDLAVRGFAGCRAESQCSLVRLLFLFDPRLSVQP